MKRPSQLFVALGLALSVGAAFAAQVLPTVEVYKSAYCGCCGQWVEHMRKAGFHVNVHETEDGSGVRRQLGMPERFGACHTAKVGGYLVEGHVPANDVKRMLAEKPKALGIAVPSMPPGAPGMEGPRSIPYETLLVQGDGSASVFAKH